MLTELRRVYPTGLIAAAFSDEDWLAEQLEEDFDACIDLADADRWQMRHPQIHRRSVDVLVDATEEHRAAIMGWSGRVPHRIGLTAKSWSLSARLYTARVPRRDPLASFEFLCELGLEPNRDLIPFGPHADTARRVDEFLRSSHLHSGFLAIHVRGNGVPAGQAELLGRVAKELGESEQIPCLVLWNGNRGLAAARRTVACSGGHALLCDPRPPSDIAGIIARSRTLVSDDSQLRQIASTTGTSVLAPTSDGDEMNAVAQLAKRCATACSLPIGRTSDHARTMRGRAA